MKQVNKAVNFIKYITAIALLASSSSTQASSDVHWSYAGQDGPNNWANLANEYQLCGSGQNQSPINIQATVKSKLFKLTNDYYNVPLHILNNGHTIEISYATISHTEAHQISINGKNHLLPSATSYNSSLKVSGEKYSLRQVHFHSPSEHQVNGKHHRLEAHFVHANSAGQLAVVGLLFNEGDANPFISKLWEFMPGEAGTTSTVEGITINAADLLPESLDYYHYRGSLTTPPCSEAVRWFVLKASQTVSKAQVRKFLSVVGENNRPVQPINARFLLSSK